MNELEPWLNVSSLIIQIAAETCLEDEVSVWYLPIGIVGQYGNCASIKVFKVDGISPLSIL